MSKVFRRPMFRGGSTNMNGIMSGIEDRKNYSIGTESPSAGDRYKEIYDKYAQPAIDPLGKYLIQGSLQGFSENRGGSTLGNLGLAFGGENLNQLFSDIEGQRTSARDMELAKLGYDIEDETAKKNIAREDLLRTEDQTFKQSLLNQEIKAKADLADLKRKFDAEQKGSDRANKLAVKIQEGENKIKELQFKKDNPGVDSAKAGVIPSIITQQMEREKSYIDSGNLLLQQSPDFHARKTVNFERSAPPEVLKNYRGVVFYGYGRKGDIEKTIPPGAGQAGDIIYDPQQSDFFIFDNQGNTYRYDPLTNQAED
jgi:hypothetical protein